MESLHTTSPFDDVQVIGDLPPEELVIALRQMGDFETADEIASQIADGARGDDVDRLLIGGPRKPWSYRTPGIGYFPMPRADEPLPDFIPIKEVGTVLPDETLKNQRINIHLDRLRVFEYPGRFLGRPSEHHILVSFTAQNQLPDAPEPLSFCQTYQAYDGDLAGVRGYPVFVGLTVGQIGVGFTFLTVNVKNTEDDKFLTVLDSAPFKSGLNLLSVAQPAIKPFTEIALGISKMFLARNENRAVQKVSLGLDFTRAAGGAGLAEGNYIVAQIPFEGAVNWSDWVYSASVGAVVSQAAQQSSLPYNYLMFRVTRYEGT